MKKRFKWECPRCHKKVKKLKERIGLIIFERCIDCPLTAQGRKILQRGREWLIRRGSNGRGMEKVSP